MTLRQRWQKTTLANKLLVTVGAAAACFIAGQLWILKTSGDQTASQTESLIQAEIRIASSMETAIRENREAIASSDAQNTALIKSGNEQSKAALDASILNSRNDQRAWVGPVAATAPEVNEGSTLDATVIFTNSGKTPALRFTHRLTYSWQPKEETFKPHYGQTEQQPVSNGVLQPAGQQNLPLHAQLPLTKQQADEILSGKMILYSFGEARYQDVFNRPHQTTFCFYLTIARLAWTACDTCNDAN